MCASAHSLMPRIRWWSDRHGRVHGAGEQAVALDGAQRPGEHLLADPGQPAGQLGVAHRARRVGAVDPGAGAGRRCQARPGSARPTCRRSDRAAGGWGSFAKNASQSTFAWARFWAAVVVGTGCSFLSAVLQRAWPQHRWADHDRGLNLRLRLCVSTSMITKDLHAYSVLNLRHKKGFS